VFENVPVTNVISCVSDIGLARQMKIKSPCVTPTLSFQVTNRDVVFKTMHCHAITAVNSYIHTCRTVCKCTVHCKANVQTTGKKCEILIKITKSLYTQI
jgi:hypothetical protein